MCCREWCENGIFLRKDERVRHARIRRAVKLQARAKCGQVPLIKPLQLQDFPCTRGTIYNATPLGLRRETPPTHATSLIPYQQQHYNIFVVGTIATSAQVQSHVPIRG